MMGFTKITSVIVASQLIIQFFTFIISVNGQPITKTDDEYRQVTGTNGLYKIYPTYQNWDNASKTCNSDNASLFYPNDDIESKAVLEVWNKTLLFRWLQHKKDSTPEKELFENITARPIWELYNDWNPDQQKINASEEGNVVLVLNDGEFSKNFPFICKKTLKQIDKLPDLPKEATIDLRNGDPMTKNEYEYKQLPGTNDFYKMYPTFQTWETTNKICNSDEATLFYPLNDTEASAVIELWNQTLLYRWSILSNDSKPEQELFQNVTARPIWELYNSWKPEKEEINLSEEANFLLLSSDGQISKNFPFICKKTLKVIDRVHQPSKPSKDKEVAPKGYKYFVDTKSYYKIHTKFATWKNAKETCAKEGATLFYPENKCECNVILNFWNQTQFFRKIYVGVSSAKNGSFETVNGRPVWDVYNNWNPGEPNNMHHEEGCVVLMRNGTMNDEKCNMNIPFICKINDNDSEVANCDKQEIDKSLGLKFRKDYTYIEDTNSVYKIHTIQHNWKDAKEICKDEGSSLFFPENDCEASAVLRFWKQTQPIAKAFIGFSKTEEGVFETTDGRSINSVYNKWKPGQPDNNDHNENCVLFYPDGTLNDENCNVETPFICKKKMGSDAHTSVPICDVYQDVSVVPPTNSIETTEIHSADIQDDYKPLKGTGLAYKIYPTYSTWKEANNTCATEGATLFYPFNECEAHNVLEFWNETLTFRWIFTGVTTATPVKKMFQNVKNRPIWELYNTWYPEESKNDTNEDGKAVLLFNEELITNFPFICKKILNTNLTEIPCSKPERFPTNKEENNNYVYINATKNLYKIHTTFKTWKDANITCTKEDAILFYPDNKCEANAVLDMWNKTQFFKRIYVGISSAADDVFTTVDGRPDWEVYHNWQGGEPNDNNGEGCVTLARNGTLNDVNCRLSMPFICKKKPTKRTNDAICDEPEKDENQDIKYRKDYTYLENTQSVYKFHPRIRRWQEARNICAKEGTELYFPENECEVTAVVKFWEKTQSINEIYVGISSNKTGEFYTVDERPLWKVYSKFNPGEPNNLGNNENCLVLTRHGNTYNDDRCDVKHAFICKKKIEDPKRDALCKVVEKNKTAVTVFRNDYKYIEATASVYKIHTIARSWLDAKEFCTIEGAALFFPETECEAQAVLNFWNDTQLFPKVFIGISSPKEGIFKTIDGRLAQEVYNKWSKDGPTFDHNKDCVLFNKVDGTLSNSRCDKIRPFICKKEIGAPKGNKTICDKSENLKDHQSAADYTFLEDTHDYYKLHTNLTTWEEAKIICASEGADFFYPENDCEADAVFRYWNITKSTPWLFIGVTSPVAAGVFATVDGRPISEVYNKWAPGEPNNADDAEGCVVLRRDGTLNDEHCDKKFAFMCKRNNLNSEGALCDKKAQSEALKAKFFRKDYTYIDNVENFYKIHTTPGSWQYAKKKCLMEGAKLFYPENITEVDAVLDFLNETQPIRYIFIGVTDLLAKEDFETIDGRPLSEVYDKWGFGEPNDANGIEDCVVLRSDGTLNDDQCSKKYPFICKKSLATLQWNDRCNMADTNYIYDEVQNKCYKFHATPKNWTDAYTVCSTEQSYLAVINSQEEADLLAKITEQAPKDKAYGNYLGGAVHLGFHNLDKKGWRTLKGESLSFTGYDKWDHQQPDGGDNELCGTMFNNGKLNDLECFQKCFFICEHDIKS